MALLFLIIHSVAINAGKSIRIDASQLFIERCKSKFLLLSFRLQPQRTYACGSCNVNTACIR